MCLLLLNLITLLLARTPKPVCSNEVSIGPNVKLPSTYDVQILPSVPVHVNVSVILFEIISVDEPKQVECFKSLGCIIIKIGQHVLFSADTFYNGP